MADNPDDSLHRHRLRQIPRLIDVRALQHRNVVRQQLQRHRVHDRRDQTIGMRHPDHGSETAAYGRLRASESWRTPWNDSARAFRHQMAPRAFGGKYRITPICRDRRINGGLLLARCRVRLEGLKRVVFKRTHRIQTRAGKTFKSVFGL